MVRKLVKSVTFFPGYVLIEADLVGEIPHTIKAIPGVIGFLGADQRRRACSNKSIRS